jgi:hypothetical protein
VTDKPQITTIDETEKLIFLGGIVSRAMAEITKAEADFGDSDWFDGASLTNTITLADGTEWAITVERAEAEAA